MQRTTSRLNTLPPKKQLSHEKPKQEELKVPLLEGQNPASDDNINAEDQAQKKPLSMQDIAKKTHSNLNLFEAAVNDTAKQDNSTVNAMLKKQNLRNKIAGDVLKASRKGNLKATGNKWEQQNLKALSKWWNKTYKGRTRNALASFARFLINTISRQDSVLERPTLSRATAVTVLRHFEKHPEEAEVLSEAHAADAHNTMKLIDTHLPQDEVSKAQVKNIHAALSDFSEYALNNAEKGADEVKNKALVMLDTLVNLIPDEPVLRNNAKLHLKTILSAAMKLTNELDIPMHEKNELIKNYFFSCKEFSELLFNGVKTNPENPDEGHALTALKNIVSHHISQSVFLGVYKPKTLGQKAEIFMYRTVAPISALLSKSAGILGAHAAATGTFSSVASLSAIHIIGPILHFVVCSIPFVGPEIALMILYACAAARAYDDAKTSISADVQVDLRAFLKNLGIEEPSSSPFLAKSYEKSTLMHAIQDVAKQEKDAAKLDAQKKATIPRRNHVRGALSDIRTLKPGLENRVLIVDNNNTGVWTSSSAKKSKSLERAEAKRIEKTVKQSPPEGAAWYNFIAEVDEKKHAHITDAAARSKLISDKFFNALRADHPELSAQINRLIYLSHELSNKSDGRPIVWIEQTHKEITSLSREISELVFKDKPEDFKKYLELNVSYFALVMANTPRTTGNKVLRRLGFVIMPFTNFGVLKGESIAVVKLIHSVPGELSAGMVAGGATLAVAGAISCILVDVSNELDKEGINKVNQTSVDFIKEHLEVQKDNREKSLQLVKEWAEFKQSGKNVQKAYVLDNHAGEKKDNLASLDTQLEKACVETPNKFCTVKMEKNADAEIVVTYKFVDSLSQREEGYFLYPISQNDIQTFESGLEVLSHEIAALSQAEDAAPAFEQDYSPTEGAIMPFSLTNWDEVSMTHIFGTVAL